MTPPNPSIPMPQAHGRHRFPVPQRVPVKRCFAWLLAGWRMFAERPAEWILISLVAFAIQATLSIMLGPIPLIGPILPLILAQLLLGGLLTLAEANPRGLRRHFILLFAGFRRHPGNLALVGIFFALPLILVSLLAILAGAGLLVSLFNSSVGLTLSHLATDFLGMVLDFGFALGVFFLLWGLLLLTLLFSPALIMFAGTPPLEAMRLSLMASLRNLGAILLLTCIEAVLFTVAMLPLGLGILIFIPLAVGTLLAAYRDLFADPGQDKT